MYLLKFGRVGGSKYHDQTFACSQAIELLDFGVSSSWTLVQMSMVVDGFTLFILF
jgi:hypothetical protein